MYRHAGKVDPDPEKPRVSLTFWERWSTTLFVGAGYFGVGIFIQLATGGPTWWWALGGGALLLVCAVLDTKWEAPDRLRRKESRLWLTGLPRTPNGGALITRETWGERPAELRNKDTT